MIKLKRLLENKQTVNEGLSRDAISRMDSLVKKSVLNQLFGVINKISSDLIDDGFSESDVAEYLYMKIKKILR